MSNQKVAYFNAITSVMKENNKEFVENQTVCKESFNTEMRSQVIEIVMAGFKAGTIPLKDTPANKEKLADDAKLRDYANSTLTNWLNKDTRLNGGVKHIIKNKGSRAGQGDKFVKNFKALQAQFEPGSDQHALIQGKIEARQAEIRTSKSKKVEVDLDLIDPELRAELGI